MRKTMRQMFRRLTPVAVVAVTVWTGMSCRTAPAEPAAEQTAAADERAESAENVRLVGYNDLQGRQSLQLIARSDAANGNWVYVGHQPNDRPNSEEPQMNSI